MKKLIFVVMSMMALFFGGCATKVYNTQKVVLPKNCVVVPFANFTQTQMAGYKVAGILEGVLKSRGYHVTKSLWDFPEQDYTLTDIKNIIKNTKANYVVTGYVNEYKYKTGIDAEPAVSVTMKIYDKKLNKYIYRGTFAIVGTTYDSLGVVTQEGFNGLLDEIFKK